MICVAKRGQKCQDSHIQELVTKNFPEGGKPSQTAFLPGVGLLAVGAALCFGGGAVAKAFFAQADKSPNPMGVSAVAGSGALSTGFVVGSLALNQGLGLLIDATAGTVVGGSVLALAGGVTASFIGCGALVLMGAAAEQRREEVGIFYLFTQTPDEQKKSRQPTH